MRRADSLDSIISKLKDGNVKVASQTPYEKGRRVKRRIQSGTARKRIKSREASDPWGVGKIKLPKGTGE